MYLSSQLMLRALQVLEIGDKRMIFYDELERTGEESDIIFFKCCIIVFLDGLRKALTFRHLLPIDSADSAPQLYEYVRH
jgi:hypothetical protein